MAVTKLDQIYAERPTVWSKICNLPSNLLISRENCVNLYNVSTFLVEHDTI